MDIVCQLKSVDDGSIQHNIIIEKGLPLLVLELVENGLEFDQFNDLRELAKACKNLLYSEQEKNSSGDTCSELISENESESDSASFMKTSDTNQTPITAMKTSLKVYLFPYILFQILFNNYYLLFL